MRDPYLPVNARIIERTQESSDIFTLTLEMPSESICENHRCFPGQFNMLYLFGVGEVAISIVSDPEDQYLKHTIRSVGRVTRALSKLTTGDCVGVRGPFGIGWPLEKAKHKDVLVITGGLGCAPSVGIIHYILKRRREFGHLTILQGVKHSDDLIYRQYYQQWATHPNTTVLLAADVSRSNWPWFTGFVIQLIDQIKINTENTICMMCGPEAMIGAAIKRLTQCNLPEESIYISMERNMECALGHCGHCQLGSYFVCKDGPIFCYSEIKSFLGKEGF